MQGSWGSSRHAFSVVAVFSYTTWIKLLHCSQFVTDMLEVFELCNIDALHAMEVRIIGITAKFISIIGQKLQWHPM